MDASEAILGETICGRLDYFVNTICVDEEMFHKYVYYQEKKEEPRKKIKVAFVFDRSIIFLTPGFTQWLFIKG